MPNIRAQVRIPGASSLPEDVYVNTYHFVRLDSVEEAADVLTPQFNTLYNAIGIQLSPYVRNPVEVRYYDLADPEPRVPETREMTITESFSSTTVLPQECSVVVSFHGAPPVTARRRGRVYLGPLNDGAAASGNNTTPPRVSDLFIGALATAFEAFLAEGNGWAIRSTVPSENFVTVVGGWIDNEWDTQRRRGLDASARLVWPD